eukprot:13356770-Alexandrium_andersonii.AAC.1
MGSSATGTSWRGSGSRSWGRPGHRLPSPGRRPPRPCRQRPRSGRSRRRASARGGVGPPRMIRMPDKEM